MAAPRREGIKSTPPTRYLLGGLVVILLGVYAWSNRSDDSSNTSSLVGHMANVQDIYSSVPFQQLTARTLQINKEMAQKTWNDWDLKANTAETELNRGNAMRLWSYYSPQVNCPDRLRVGGLNDGGKWMCGLLTFLQRPECVVYSFGSNGETAFEEAVVNYTPCEVHVFDPFIPAEAKQKVAGLHPRISFHDWGVLAEDKTMNIDNQPYDMKTIPSIMRILGHDWVDILKIDVEGHEYDTFKSLLGGWPDSSNSFAEPGGWGWRGKGEAKLPYSQILVEVHANTWKTSKLIEGVMDDGFRILNWEPNLFAERLEPQIYVEVAFIRVNENDVIDPFPRNFRS